MLFSSLGATLRLKNSYRIKAETESGALMVFPEREGRWLRAFPKIQGDPFAPELPA